MSTPKDEIIAGGSYVPEFVTPTGSYKLDLLLDHGGWPSGSIIHMFSSKEGSFKTAFGLMGLANIQQAGHPVGFVDAENALGIDWAKGIGIDDDPERWFYSMPTDGETALNHVEAMVEDYGCKGVILDSIDACQPTKYMEGDYGESVMMAHAKLMNKFARRIPKVAKANDATIFIINQMRTGNANGVTYNTPSGGKGLGFYSTINMEMKRTQSKSRMDGNDEVPLEIRVRRSKLSRSFRTIETCGKQGSGLDTDAELLDLAVELCIIEKGGSWYTFPDGTKAQGGASAKDWVAQNRNLVIDEL